MRKDGRAKDLRSGVIGGVLAALSVVALASCRVQPRQIPDSGEWRLLGRGQADFAKSFVVIRFPPSKGNVRTARIIVRGYLEMLFIKFVFADGGSWEPQGRMVFDAAAPRRDLDLPGAPRALNSLEFQFQGPRGPTRWKAVVELWGK